MGDIPVKHDNKGDQISNPAQVQINEFNSVSSPGMTQVKNSVVGGKKHQYAQSVLLNDQQLQGGAPSGKHPFSKSIIQSIPSPHANIKHISPQDFDANGKQSMTQKS